MRKIVFDIETRNIFQDVGTNNPADLDISVVCIYDSKTDSFSSYLVEQLPNLWKILEETDLIIGYNSEHFDLPLLQKYAPKTLDLSKIKHIDLLKELKNVAKRRMKLDQVAEGTLGTNKSGGGLDAVVWWRKGEIDKIIKYCIDDVRITRDVYEFARKNGHLKFKEGGKLNEIKLDTSDWENLPEQKPQMASLFG